MSDVDLYTSPRSNSSSDNEKPPTPGHDYDENQDGDELDYNVDSEAVEKEDDDRESIQSKSSSDGVQEESDGESPDGPVSPKTSASVDDAELEETRAVLSSDVEEKAPSPENDDSGDKMSEDMEIEKEDDDNGDDDDDDDDARSEDARSGDARSSDNPEKVEKEKDFLSEGNDTREIKVDESKTKDEEGENASQRKIKSPSKRVSCGNNADDGDLLQISDLSVDLTGDEAAIVEDILQNAGDGELIPSNTTAEEKPPVDGNIDGDGDNADEKSGSPQRSSPKPSQETKEPTDEQEEHAGGTGELLADIFGSSDEDEDFEGFQKDDLSGSTKSKKKTKEKREKKPVIDSDEEKEEEEVPKAELESQVDTDTPKESLVVPPPDDGKSSDSEDEGRNSEIFVSDFDMMMQQKKEENRKTRRRKNVDIINDSDDMVADLIKRMQEAAQEDRLANEARQAATKKLVLLPSVLKHMLKIDLMVVFIDCNVLPVLKEWISPLPDGSLPHLQIREGILKILKQLPPVDSGALKVSGIGKAVMYLFKHPKETRKNKECAGKLISEWSRPIFGVTADFKSMSREEREERDYVNKSKRRRLSSDNSEGGKTPKRIENAIKSESTGLRPGDKGWCMRARVPAPSNKDYVVRPKSNIEFVDFSKSPKKSLNRFEKQKRKFNEKRGTSGKQRAVEISLEGRKMAL